MIVGPPYEVCWTPRKLKNVTPMLRHTGSHYLGNGTPRGRPSIRCNTLFYHTIPYHTVLHYTILYYRLGLGLVHDNHGSDARARLAVVPEGRPSAKTTRSRCPVMRQRSEG